jgi:ATP-dependent Clp protease ATP-binding subunit ClpA
VVLLKHEASPELEKIGFEFVEGPVTPKSEVPAARKRKPKSGGGGSKGPAPKGALVKA